MYGILVAVTKCIDCQGCADACVKLFGFNQWQAMHDLAVTADGLSAHRACTVLNVGDGQFARKSCMHCLEPSCVSACPVGGIDENSRGAGRLRSQQVYWLPLLHAGLSIPCTPVPMGQDAPVYGEVQYVRRPPRPQ